MVWGRAWESDSGWVGADAADDLDARLAAEDEHFDLRRPHVLTALGPVEPGALGLTQFGERLLDRADDEPPGGGTDRFDVAVAELEDLYAVGVRCVVALDRDHAAGAGELRRLAARSLLHLVLVADAADGDVAPDSVLGAVRVRRSDDLAAGLRCRLPLLVDAPVLPRQEPVRAAILGAETPPPSVTVLGAANLARAEREEWLAAGATLAFDAFAATGEVGPAAGIVAALTGEGWADRVVLGSGLTAPSRLRACGGDPGWAGLLERFSLDLMACEVPAAAIKAMLVDSPQRQLTIPGRVAAGQGEERR